MRPVTPIALTRCETEARLTAVAPAIRALGVVLRHIQVEIDYLTTVSEGVALERFCDPSCVPPRLPIMNL